MRKQQYTIDRWGPNLWRSLHVMAHAYPRKPSLRHRRAMRRLVMSLPELLPCKNCAGHFRKELRRNPLRTRSRRQLTRWLVDIHNTINARLRKPIITYREAEEMYAPPQLREISSDETNEKEEKTPKTFSPSVIASISVGSVLIIAICVVILFLLLRRKS